MSNKWFNDGYKQALGKKGTKWMQYSKGDYTGSLDDEESLDNFSEGWLETLQWEHEVGKYLPKMIDKDGEINDEWSDARAEWIIGYSAGIRKIESKK